MLETKENFKNVSRESVEKTTGINFNRSGIAMKL